MNKVSSIQNFRPTGMNKSLLLATSLTAALALSAVAQSYTVVELAPTSPVSIAYGLSSSGAVGNVSPTLSTVGARATLWDGVNQIDLHPAIFDDAATGTVGRSTALGAAGNVQVGWGSGVINSNRLSPVMWRGTAASATVLTIPFATGGGQAVATDGKQIVGYATGVNKDGTALSTSRGIVWDVATGAATDLGDGGGSGAFVYGVGGGKQVGYVFKSLAVAAMWSGTSKSLVTMNPVNAVMSVANATDGVRQVGYAGYDVRVRVEAVKGNKDARFNYATVWTGTAASAVNIHPYPFTHSYAMSVAGSYIAGYGADAAAIGTPAYFHAIVWDGNFQFTDLNNLLPAGFVGSQALAVDANGNVAGYMMAADGTRHAVVWMLTAAK
ncbi:MAG: hypothetical protein RLY20_1240 [Verrucomicrobiota bacterium]|jgi:hypothetical protein